jgi:TRAP-type C4-dicarboxylate transport system permease small subunit
MVGLVQNRAVTGLGIMLRKVLDRLYLLAGYAAGVFLVAIFVLMMVLSAGRPLGINLPAGDDFAAWCMAATAFLGLAHTFRSGEMIRVGLLIDRFDGDTRRVIEIASLVVGCGFIGFFAWLAAVMIYQTYVFNDMAQGVVPVPLWIPQLGYSGGLVILLIAFVDELVHVLRGNDPRYEKPKPQTAEEIVERAAQSAV